MKSTQKPLIRKLTVPVYKSALWIIVNPSVHAAIDYVEDMINTRIATDREKSYIRAMMFAEEKENRARRFMIFLSPKAKPGEIAHECKHLVNMVFKWHGERLSLSNDENECYYLEDIVDKVHKTIALYKKKYPKVKKQKQSTDIIHNEAPVV